MNINPIPKKKHKDTVSQMMPQQNKDQEDLVEIGMASEPRTAASYIPLWKWTTYLPYLLLAVAYLLIITLFALVFSKASKISAEVSQLREESKNLFPCGSRSREWEYFDGQCYYFSVDMATWHTARANCEDKNAHLVVIHDEAEQNFVQSKTRSERFWIGLNDQAGEGEWIWIDGTEYRNSFKKWKKGEPNNHEDKEDCAHMDLGGEWNDLSCNAKFFYICQKPFPS